MTNALQKRIKSFEDFLTYICATLYVGPDDFFPEFCDDRIQSFDADDFIKYADQYVKHREKKLVEALELLKMGDCWCEMAIGNPMVTSHSKGCSLVQEILKEAKAL